MKSVAKPVYAQQKFNNAQKPVPGPAMANPTAAGGDVDIMYQNIETMKEFDSWCVEVLLQINPLLDGDQFFIFLFHYVSFH